MFARSPFALRRFSLPRPARSGKSRFSRRSLRRRPGHWETLGVGMHGTEMLEQRMMLAADLELSFNDADAWYAPATQTAYTLTVSNIGPDTAQNAVLTTALGSQISGAVWSAAYQNGGVGPLSGAGGPLRHDHASIRGERHLQRHRPGRGRRDRGPCHHGERFWGRRHDPGQQLRDLDAQVRPGIDCRHG